MEGSMKPIEFELVSLEEAKRVIEGDLPKRADPTQSTDRRAQISQEPLLGVTRAWLASLPPDVRPTALAEQFPRIANRLRHLWKQAARCEEYLDDLIVDRRCSRKGFPPQISQELTVLREYYALLHPNKALPWEHVEQRK